jgi:CRP/FNR family cyclic AMP-dependent transcriptional regulator
MELLEGMPLFSTCTKRQLAQVAALTVQADLPKGTVMTHEGAIGGLAYLIATGQAEVTRNGKRIARVGPGDVVGELSLIDGKQRSATVRKLLEALAQRVREVDERSTV